jgi:hypothetical protein
MWGRMVDVERRLRETDVPSFKVRLLSKHLLLDTEENHGRKRLIYLEYESGVPILTPYSHICNYVR